MQHYIIPADPRSRGLKLGSLHARVRRHGYWITHDRHAGTWSLVDADLRRPLVGLQSVPLIDIARAITAPRGNAHRG